jgi:hypothetical protein
MILCIREKTRSPPPRPKPSSFFAPAKHQRLCSFLISLMIEETDGEAPSKTQAFLCFEIVKIWSS